MKSKKPEQITPSELRKRAEKKLKPQVTPPKGISESDKETKQLFHELHVRQIELEMQNDELRKARAELEESRAKYFDFYDFAPVGFFTIDKHGLILQVNLTAARELGVERNLLINTPFRAFIVMQDRKLFDSHLQRVLKSDIRQTCDIRLKSNDGKEFYVQLESIAANDLKGNTLCRTSVSDITGRKRAEESFKRLYHQNDLILNAAGEGILGLDVHGNHTFVNPAAVKMLGYDANELIGKHSHTIWHHTKTDGSPYPEVECPIYAALKSGSSSHRRDEVFWRKDGTSFAVSYSATPIQEGSNIIGAVVTFLDITESKLMEEKLKKLAITDTLTGALNRTIFREIVERETERVKRYNQRLSMILFDIDHFKEVNDRYGHNAGDHVLKAIADIVRENIRKIDYLVRWGGEEFIILSSETPLDKAHVLADRIRITIENTKFKKVGNITVSFGVTEYKEEDTGDSFIIRADDAMYAAKKKGRNRVEVSV